MASNATPTPPPPAPLDFAPPPPPPPPKKKKKNDPTRVMGRAKVLPSPCQNRRTVVLWVERSATKGQSHRLGPIMDGVQWNH